MRLSVPIFPIRNTLISTLFSTSFLCQFPFVNNSTTLSIHFHIYFEHFLFSFHFPRQFASAYRFILHIFFLLNLIYILDFSLSHQRVALNHNAFYQRCNGGTSSCCYFFAYQRESRSSFCPLQRGTSHNKYVFSFSQHTLQPILILIVLM